MNKKMVKILSIILLLVCATFFINNIVYAAGKSGTELVKEFNGTDDGSKAKEGTTLITNILGMILSAVRIVATGVAVIMITFLGIKYMSAAPSEKANIKNQLITFTIGAIVVVGTTTLLDIIKNFANNVFK